MDWVFGAAWVTDDHFVTASRDCTVKLWRVGGYNEQNRFVNCSPLDSQTQHTAKVSEVVTLQKERVCESGAGGLTREVERPLPSNHLRCDQMMPLQLKGPDECAGSACRVTCTH
jgi:hypothetical protein